LRKITLLLMFASGLMSAQVVDAIATTVLTPYTVKDKVFHPVVEVENNGSMVLDEVEVVFELLDAGNTVLATETQTYSGLALNNADKARLKLDTDWLLDVTGMFKIKCTLNVTGDETPANNVLEIDMESVELDYTNLEEGAGYVFTEDDFYKTNVDNTAPIWIADIDPVLYPFAIKFIDGILYGMRGHWVGSSIISTWIMINGDGTIYEMGTINTEPGYIVFGMTWDAVTNQVYVINSGGFQFSTLSTLDIETLDLTVIDLLGTNNQLYYAIEFGADGVMYGLNHATANIDIIDPTDASTTPLPNGLSNYNVLGTGFDLSYNYIDSTLYVSLRDMNQSSTVSVYCSVDVTTGMVTPIFDIDDTEGTMTMAHPNIPSLGVNDIEASQFVIYPNPTQNSVTVEMLDLESTNYKILSIDGRVLLNGVINHQNKTIDISSLASSTYIIYFEANGKQSTKKIIKL